jgi:hypothetical protein
MANVLTGDYEAVLQIAIRQINGVLGTLHQNRAMQNAALELLHSTTEREILDRSAALTAQFDLGSTRR